MNWRSSTPSTRRLILEKRLGGAEGLRERIAELLGGGTYTLTHALLAGLPATEFVTTNYDELFERAPDAAGMPVVALPYEPVTQQPQRWLLKLHGTVSSPADIVLTREDYLRYPDRRGALAALVQALLITRHMLFVGFSLGDDNFHRIVDDVRKALGDRGPEPEPFGTALMVRAPSFTQELWKDDLDIVALDEAEVALAARSCARDVEHTLGVPFGRVFRRLPDAGGGAVEIAAPPTPTMRSPTAWNLPSSDPARRLLESFGSSSPVTQAGRRRFSLRRTRPRHAHDARRAGHVSSSLPSSHQAGSPSVRVRVEAAVFELFGRTLRIPNPPSSRSSSSGGWFESSVSDHRQMSDAPRALVDRDCVSDRPSIEVEAGALRCT